LSEANYFISTFYEPYSYREGTPMTPPSADALIAGPHTIAVYGIPQRYHVYGNGPICVVQPGGPGIFWEYLRMPALEEHLTMVYVEALGTGASGRLAAHPNGYTRQLYSDAIDRLLDHLGQDKVHLLGHSYGGFVAQRYALDHADRLSGLILYESAPVTGLEHSAEAARQLAGFASRNRGNSEVPAVLAALGSVSGITDDDEVGVVLRGLLPAYFADYWGREAEFCQLRETVKAAYISGFDGELVPDPIDDRAALPSLTVPTLVVVGRYDVVCGVRWADELHTLIPQSRMEILENSGHFGHLEEPDAFAVAIRYFVAATSNT
jgi:proline iminopeptidase